MGTLAENSKTTQQTKSAENSSLDHSHVGQGHAPNPIFHLQHAIGNQAVLRMLQCKTEKPNAAPAAKASPPLAHNVPSVSVKPAKANAIQTKLTVGAPGDEYEQEADRVAQQVMSMPSPGAPAPLPVTGAVQGMQRKVAAPQVSRSGSSPTGSGMTAPPIVHDVLNSAGQPLDSATRAFMEPRFGYDFGSVRLHTGGSARSSAADLGARAYTVGPHVVLRDESPSHELLAHELTHVVQQGGAGTGQAPQAVNPPRNRMLQRQHADKSGEAPGNSSASPYPEEEAVLRAGIGARDSGGLADGTVVYSAKGWQVVGLSEAAFAAGPFTSDMGSIFYVYRFEGTGSGKGTRAVSRGVHLAGWNAKITPELRSELEKVKGNETIQVASPGQVPSTRETVPQPSAKQPVAKKDPAATPDKGTAPSLPAVWIPPTDGVVQSWMYNQIDNWHTGAIQGLTNFKDAVKGETSVGFWLGLGGNVIWALGSFGAPPVAVTVGLIGIAIGTIGGVVQTHADKSEADRVDAIYQDLLKGFNNSRSQMDAEVIRDANAIMATDDFKNAVATKSTVAWEAVVRKLANMPEGRDIDQISKNTERNLYNAYLKDRGSYYTRDIFNVENPNHPGFDSEEDNLWLHDVPDKVRDRLTAIGVNWKRIYDLPIPHRDRELYRKSGTVGAIKYWDYNESTAYPPSWTQSDIAEFLKKAPSYVGETRTGTTY
jgi:hypothetical protein